MSEQQITQPLVHIVADEEVTGKAKELFENMKKASGEVPEWMRVMANCEDVLVGFFTLFSAVMDNSPVDRILKWKLAYLISDLNKCEYCVSIALMWLKNLGIKEEEIKSLDKNLSERESVALEYAKAATEHAYRIDEGILRKMKETFSDAQIVEITSVVGLFSFINRFNDALGVLPN